MHTLFCAIVYLLAIFNHVIYVLCYLNIPVSPALTASTHRAVPFYFYFNEEEENPGLMSCQAEI